MSLKVRNKEKAKSNVIFRLPLDTSKLCSYLTPTLGQEWEEGNVSFFLGALSVFSIRCYAPFQQRPDPESNRYQTGASWKASSMAPAEN